MMASYEYLEHVQVPGGGKTLALVSFGDDFAISVDGNGLMGTDEHGSEDALADQACDRLADLGEARVLVGGLGMGFTLAAVLRRLGPNGVATVAELIPEIVDWNRRYLGHKAGHPLRDERVEVCVGDIAALMQTPKRRWNAILLDVDNGPQAFTKASNHDLYTKAGLQRAYDALEPDGILAVWSYAYFAPFTDRLTAMGFETEVLHEVAAGKNGEEDYEHVLWMARKPR